MTLTSTRQHVTPPARFVDPLRSREPHLGDYMVMIRRYWPVIAVAIVLALLIGMSVHLTAPARYKARVDVVVIATSEVTAPGAVSSDVSIDSAVQILLSDQVLGVTARELDYPGRSSGLLTDMTISPLINSRILRLYVTSSTAQMAYDAVKLLVKNFLSVREAALVADEESAAATIQAQLTSIHNALEQPASPLVQLDRSPTINSRELVAEQNRLETQLISLRVNAPAPGYISHQATLPASTVRSGGYLVMASAASVGLLLGCAAAAVLDKRWRRRPPIVAV